jgi:hypothetical protein
MSRRFLILLLAAGIGTGWASAGEREAKNAAKKSAAEQSARLILELASDDFDVRERAVRELEALGPAAGPTLQKAIASNDPEVRHLALQVVEKIARKMEAAEVLEPKRFRVAFRDVPLHVAIAEFMRASGARLQLDQSVKSQRKVSLDTGYTTFWDAFDKFCTATGLAEKLFDTPAPDVQANYQGQWGARRRMVIWGGRWVQQHQDEIIPALANGQFVLVEAKPVPRPFFQAGALRFRALPPGTTLGRASNFMGDKELVFGLEILPDPTLAWEKVLSLHIDKAIDDQGQNLQATQAVSSGAAPMDEDGPIFWDGGYDYGGSGNNGGQRVPLRLALGRKRSAVLKELSGVATIKMQTRTQAIATIDDILKAKDKTAKGSDGSFLKVIEVKREEGGKVEIHVKVEQRQDEEAVNNPWGWGGIGLWRGGATTGEEQVDSSVSTGHLTLFDARGNLVRLVSKEQIPDENGNEEYRFIYQVAKGQPEPAKLVLQGRKPVSIDVPFTLKDIPLRPTPGAPKPAPPPPNGPQGSGPASEALIDQ